MIGLPDLVLLKIFNNLGYQDLINVGSVCTRFHKLANYDILWKEHCEDVWLIADKSSDFYDVTWKERFILYYLKFSKYISCYKKVKSCWLALEKYLQEYGPEIYQTLNPGVDEEILTQFENERKVILPNDYKLSYLLHNGQNCDGPGVYGLFGGIFLPAESYFCSGLCPFSIAVDSYSAQCTYALPITYTQSLKLAVSQLVLPKDSISLGVSHNREIIAFRDLQYCSIAESFSDWFSEYVNKLVHGHYPIVQGNILLYDKDTEVTETTKFITISVRWSYNHAFNTIISSTDLFTYHITMCMSSDAPESESCKLLTRHWDIHDANGSSHVVDGDGVVGYYPVMKPGSKFTWRSYTTFQSQHGGSMKGYFTMCYLNNPGLQLNVVCPEFIMKRPPMVQPKWTESGSFS